MAETLTGLKELNKQLKAMERRTGTKVLRSASLKATTPVLRAMRAKAPVGRKPHKTFKGRLVAPGFTKRSLRRKTRVLTRKGAVQVTMGVRSEAWYALQFFDQGPHRISTRRVSAGRRKQRKTQIKPYTLRRIPFFQAVFIANRRVMEREMANQLRIQIERAARGS